MRARAGLRAIKLKRSRKVNIVRMDDSASVSLCIIINGEKWLDIVVEFLALT